MALTDTWDTAYEASPAGSDSPTEGDDKIRQNKRAIRERSTREMYWGNADTNALHGRLREGAARVYYATTAPTNHPEAVALDANDEGRIWIKIGGAVDSGTTDADTANKLVDSSQNFITTVSAGDLVLNTTDDTNAFVIDVESNTSLALDSDIMDNAEAYSIYNQLELYIYTGTQWVKLPFDGDYTKVVEYRDTSGNELSKRLKTKVIEIGDWNMDSTTNINVAHGLSTNYKKIRSVSGIIRDDNDSNYTPFARAGTAAFTGVGTGEIGSTNINLIRVTGGTFDSATYDSTSYNRGWIYVVYEE